MTLGNRNVARDSKDTVKEKKSTGYGNFLDKEVIYGREGPMKIVKHIDF